MLLIYSCFGVFCVITLKIYQSEIRPTLSLTDIIKKYYVVAVFVVLTYKKYLNRNLYAVFVRAPSKRKLNVSHGRHVLILHCETYCCTSSCVSS